jgi:micrococcal nuclease
MIVIKNLGFIALCAILAAGCAAPPGRGADPAATATLRAKVAYVIDGDTVVVATAAGRARVRLLGIDAPEDTRQHGRHECFGAPATAELRRLLPAGSTVLLTRYPRRDPYGRDLAYVWRADGVLVNLTMVRGGYAATRFLPPGDRYRSDLTDAENMARGERAGLWRGCRWRAPRRPSPAAR